MSVSIGSINNIASSALGGVQKARVASIQNTTAVTQQPSNPATIVTLGQSNSQTTGLYSSSGVIGKPSPHAIYGSQAIANPSSSTNATTAQSTTQNQKQLQHYAAIQETAAIHQSEKSGTKISSLS